MKQIKLTPLMAEIVPLITRKSGEEVEEKVTAFVRESRIMVNIILTERSFRWRDTKHYRQGVNAVKALRAYNKSLDIYLEDSEYDVLWGSDEKPGILRAYCGWQPNEFHEEFVTAWEDAKSVSRKIVQKAMSAA